jgi:hypothetical protein
MDLEELYYELVLERYAMGINLCALLLFQPMFLTET